jgi:TRAP-type C4-dicarboxylate transport system permease small subunit
MLNYEKKHHRPAPLAVFQKRLATHLLAALAIITFAIGVGMAGYMTLADMNSVDAFLNAAMIFSGMGPVGDLPNSAAKIFAGVYAIVCGILLIGIAGLVLAPVFHRMLHFFHAD